MARTTAQQATEEVEAKGKGQSRANDSNWRTGESAHVVILKSGDGFFGIDINLVQEIVLMQEITKVPGSAEYIAGMTDLRGRVVPVAEFATLLEQEPSERSDETRILLVEHGGGHIGLIVDEGFMVTVKAGDRPVAVAVDALREQQEIVVKSLGAYIGQMEGIAGASILGDGQVVLILDVGSLIKAAMQGNCGAAGLERRAS